MGLDVVLVDDGDGDGIVGRQSSRSAHPPFAHKDTSNAFVAVAVIDQDHVKAYDQAQADDYANAGLSSYAGP